MSLTGIGEAVASSSSSSSSNGLNQTYNLSYNIKYWNPPKTSCGDGEPDEVEHYNITLTANAACSWYQIGYLMHILRLTDEGTWVVSMYMGMLGRDVYKGGNTPIGSYPDSTCVTETYSGIYLMFTDIVVS